MPYAGLCVFAWQEFSMYMLSQKKSGRPETKLAVSIIAFFARENIEILR